MCYSNMRTWVLDGGAELRKDGATKHGAQKHIEDIPEEVQLTDAAV